MTTSGDGIVYNFAHIETVGGAIDAFIRQMDQHLDDVDAAFKALNWTGAAKDEFTTYRNKWRAEADDMAATLRTLSKTVGDVRENMAAADKAAGAQFSI
ncbi:hypothetical protein GCM10023322_39910 [Rugosimonospora acidiphila]|uniref:ESAT-6-like protein n=1 Tax=Rugosimonospora acidiphila TaxID=556531 RepID=A0ABP9RZI8_9ACTN